MLISTSHFQLLCLLASLSSCTGIPLHRLSPRQDFAPPVQPTSTGSGLSPANLKPSVWIPVLVITISLVAMVILRVFWKQRQYRRVQAAQRAAAASRGEPIALTAAQLAGSGTAGTDTQRRARRTRRPRRTPSQISTKSLPAYMESPGEQEIVLVRRREESLMEEDEEVPGHRRNASEATMQSDDEDDRPLLNTSNARDSPETTARHSHDSGEGSPVDDIDARGAAPAYLEVADSDEAATRQNLGPVPSASDNDAPSTSASAATPPPRQSAFWRRMKPWSNNSPRTPPPVTTPQVNLGSPTEARQGTPSPVPSPLNTSRHRSSLSLSATVSGASSNLNNSPQPSPRSSRIHRASASITSLLGRHSTPPPPASAILPTISLPVPTSVTRTQFQYPPNGVLTPEQMAFVSSTQSLIRFSVPYGEGAALSPPNYTLGANRRGSSTVSFGVESEMGTSSSDHDASANAMASSPASYNNPLIQNGNPSHISIPRSLDPVAELPSPIALEASPAGAAAGPSDPHRRVSSSTTNTFATANQGEEDDDDASSVAHTERSSTHSRSSRLSTTTVESLPTQEASAPKEESEPTQEQLPPQAPAVSTQ